MWKVLLHFRKTTFIFTLCIRRTGKYLPQFYLIPLTYFLQICWPLLHLHVLSPIKLSFNCKAIHGVSTITDTILKGTCESQVFSSLPIFVHLWWTPSSLPLCLLFYPVTPFLASTPRYWPPALALQLCRAQSGTFSGADGLIPKFSTISVSNIKTFPEFTPMMSPNSRKTLWQRQKVSLTVKRKA